MIISLIALECLEKDDVVVLNISQILLQLNLAQYLLYNYPEQGSNSFLFFPSYQSFFVYGQMQATLY